MGALRASLPQLVPRTLTGIQREYPNGVVMRVDGPGQWAEPSDRHPIFFGCYDWHSAVHSHWQLVRLMRAFPDHVATAPIGPILETRFTTAKVAAEIGTLASWPGWEVPYGMAWMLQLGGELVAWEDTRATQWLETLEPLVEEAADRVSAHLASLQRPIRTGTHAQSAFSMGLALDWARTAGHVELEELIIEKAISFYARDRNAPLEYEPSATDFLSPALAEADLMSRVLATDDLAGWLDGFFPETGRTLLERLPPQPVVDPSDGQLAHIAGLNMSRAWMARETASALPPQHRLAGELARLADSHLDQGFGPALHPDYMVSHWAPTFVVYVCTGGRLPTSLGA